jgi:hypothetical protein
MSERMTQQAGQWLNLVGTGLTASFQPGTAFALQGIEELEAIIAATGDAASILTTMDFQLQVSDDGVNWDPVLANQLGANSTGTVHSLSVTAGQTVRDRLSTTNVRAAAYTRIVARSTGGAPKAGDIASSTLKYSSY